MRLDLGAVLEILYQALYITKHHFIKHLLVMQYLVLYGIADFDVSKDNDLHHTT